MVFTAPIWLLGLVPWGIVAVVLLMSRRPKTDVPFLELWRLNVPQESIRRNFSTPPLGIVLALLSALSAIVAAAGPGWRRSGLATLTVVVDTGGSMSTHTPAGTRRYAAAADKLRAALQSTENDAVAIELWSVDGAPGDVPLIPTTTNDLSARVAALPPSALASGPEIDRVVRQRLANHGAGVVVLSDQMSAVAGAVLIVPPPPADNIGIRHFALRRTPTPQAMLRVARSAGNAARSVTVRVSTGGQVTAVTVDVAPHASQDLFIPLALAGSVATAELLEGSSSGAATPLNDAFAADNRADLIAETDWPAVELAVNVAELQKLVDAYRRLRPAGERSTTVRLVASDSELGASTGIVLAAVGATSSSTRAAVVAAHPVAAIDWSALSIPAGDSRSIPPGTWRAILSDSAGPLLAVRESVDPLGGATVRQAWCAIDPRGWSGQVGYVVFWSTLTDWVGSVAVGERMIAHPLIALSPDWAPVERSPQGNDARYWPGVYQRGDGARRAYGPADSITGGRAATDSAAVRESVAELFASASRVTSLTPAALVLALGLLTAAAAVWRRQLRTVSGLAAIPRERTGGPA